MYLEHFLPHTATKNLLVIISIWKLGSQKVNEKGKLKLLEIVL